MTFWVVEEKQSRYLKLMGVITIMIMTLISGLGKSDTHYTASWDVLSPVFTKPSMYTLATLIEAVYLNADKIKFMTLSTCIEQ